MKCNFLRAGTLAIAALSLSTACNDDTTAPLDTAASSRGAALAQAPYQPGAASSRELYQVRLAPMNGSSDHGIVKLEIAGGYLVVTVHAEGLDPLQHIPQHIHVNPTCANGGAVLISLNAQLTVAGEAPPTGDDFPVANRAGVVNYQASRPLADLLTAANTYLGTNLASVDELLAWLDLGNRNVHMHASTAPFTPMTCGEMERVN
jgi:hypothetical protein